MNRTTRIRRMYDILLNHFGDQHWWPAETPWEVAAGALLTQNTSWKNVEQAIQNLKTAKLLTPAQLCRCPEAKLQKLIRPSGYFRQKSERLKILACWWQKTVTTGRKERLNKTELRNELLSLKGVGEETADSILTYAFNIPSFVIDTYTRRIAHRHLGTPEKIKYRELQSIFTAALVEDLVLYQNFHALLVQLGKDLSDSSGCKNECPLCLQL